MEKSFLSNMVGLFAMPAAENPTVAIMEASFRARGLDWRYLTCEVQPEDLQAAVAGARALGWKGFNCSIPHKVSVMDHIDEIGVSAEVIGAVNTGVFQDGVLIGENTDGLGFADLIQSRMTLDGKRLVVFGAGGAARAISVELALAGVSDILIVNRSKARVRSLVSRLNEKTPANAEFHHWTKTFSIPRDTNIIFNATPVGMYPDVGGRLDFDEVSLLPEMFVAEGVNNPPVTPLLETAARIGCESVDGASMLVNVCARCIRMWTGQDADKVAMRETLDTVLAK